MTPKPGSRLVDLEWKAPDFDDLHPLIQQRLRALGLTDLEEVPNERAWQSMLAWASQHIENLEDDQKRRNRAACGSCKNGGHAYDGIGAGIRRDIGPEHVGDIADRAAEEGAHEKARREDATRVS